MEGFIQQIMIRRINNQGDVVWTTFIGEACSSHMDECNIGYSLVVTDDMIYAGVGLLKDGKMRPAVLAISIQDGTEIWRLVMDSGSGHGAVRLVIANGKKLLCTGYTDASDAGFQFINDEGRAKVWENTVTDEGGKLAKQVVLDVNELTQGAKIRLDPVNGGYVVVSTAWGETGVEETNVVVIVKLNAELNVEWSKVRR